MIRFNKKLILIIMLIGILLLTGCGKFRFSIFDASETDSGSEVTVVPDDNQGNTVANSITGNDISENKVNENTDKSEDITNGVTPTSAPTQSVATIEEFTVYSVNADSGNIEMVTALTPVGSELTPELIVSTVVEAMADQSINIGIDSVTSEGDTVIVSFEKDKTPYSNYGSGYEAAILDAIAQSLLENPDGCNKVIYRVEGEAYGGSFEMDIDYVYMKN